MQVLILKNQALKIFIVIIIQFNSQLKNKDKNRLKMYLYSLNRLAWITCIPTFSYLVLLKRIY